MAYGLQDILAELGRVSSEALQLLRTVLALNAEAWQRPAMCCQNSVVKTLGLRRINIKNRISIKNRDSLLLRVYSKLGINIKNSGSNKSKGFE